MTKQPKTVKKLLTLDIELTEMLEKVLEIEGYSMQSFQDWIRKVIREKYVEISKEDSL